MYLSLDLSSAQVPLLFFVEAAAGLVGFIVGLMLLVKRSVAGLRYFGVFLVFFAVHIVLGGMLQPGLLRRYPWLLFSIDYIPLLYGIRKR
jgi:hypothetical protein